MKDIYGFEKKANPEDDANEVAGIHGFRGPSYTDAQGVPVDLSIVDPSLGTRAYRGLGGGVLGGVVGNVAGGALGRRLGYEHFGRDAGMFLGGAMGAGLGAATAPKQLMMRPSPEEQAQTTPDDLPKTASVDVYGFSKEALAAPGLLGQMSGALRGMGRAGSVAAQRAGNMYGAEREYLNSGVGKSMLEAGRTGVGSLLRSQAGRRVLGIGAGLAGAGAVGTGVAGYNALTQPTQPTPSQPPQALRMG